MINDLFIATNRKLIGVSLLLLRFIVGIILFIVGSGKVLGWFGGMGMQKTVEVFFKYNNFSPPLVYMSSYTEFIGGTLLILGLCTRPAAFAVMINMLVAGIVMLPRGFTTGASYPLSLMVSAIIIQLIGPMNYSLDYLLLSPVRSDHIFGGK